MSGQPYRSVTYCATTKEQTNHNKKIWKGSHFSFHLYSFQLINKLQSAESMEIFIKIRPILLKIGLYEFNHPHGKRIKTLLRIVTMMAVLTGATTSICFIIFKVKTFAEFAETFATVNMMTYSSLNYVAFLCRWKLFAEMIESIQLKMVES